MTLQEHDIKCNQLINKLASLKADNSIGGLATGEYMATLRALQLATRERLGMLKPTVRYACISCGAITGHIGDCASDARYGN